MPEEGVNRHVIPMGLLKSIAARTAKFASDKFLVECVIGITNMY
jgi:hypothetical protein